MNVDINIFSEILLASKALIIKYETEYANWTMCYFLLNADRKSHKICLE